MLCPNCKRAVTFSLIEAVDDYQDGYVECDFCGEFIAGYTLFIVDLITP